MSQRNIVIEPDPILRKKSERLEKVDNELKKLLDDKISKISSHFLIATEPEIINKIFIILNLISDMY